MLQEQLDQIEKTGFHALSDTPLVSVATSAPFLVAAGLAIVISCFLYIKAEKAAIMVFLCASMAMLVIACAALTTLTPNADYRQAQHEITNKVIEEKYGYFSNKQLEPDAWGENTAITIYSDDQRLLVHPEIDRSGDLKLWLPDGKLVKPLQR